MSVEAQSMLLREINIASKNEEIWLNESLYIEGI